VHASQFIVWLESLPWKGFVKYRLGVLISGIALLFVLHDRLCRSPLQDPRCLRLRGRAPSAALHKRAAGVQHAIYLKEVEMLPI
jgi:hypothetical protein